MNIVFDMDNTLTDEFGSSVRPGMIQLLDKLKKEGHVLMLWTNSVKSRAVDILLEHGLRKYFTKFIFREDYDPKNQGARKDIRKINGDVLVDDDPAEIEFMKKINKRGVLVPSFRKGKSVDKSDIERIYKMINGGLS
jgi:HAD superfamily phosphatase (TIGR01681 family)